MTPAQISKLKRLTCGMIAAASAYKEYARGWKERSKADPFKRTRVKDFEAAAEAGKELLAELEKHPRSTVFEREHEDEWK